MFKCIKIDPPPRSGIIYSGGLLRWYQEYGGGGHSWCLCTWGGGAELKNSSIHQGGVDCTRLMMILLPWNVPSTFSPGPPCSLPQPRTTDIFLGLFVVKCKYSKCSPCTDANLGFLTPAVPFLPCQAEIILWRVLRTELFSGPLLLLQLAPGKSVIIISGFQRWGEPEPWPLKPYLPVKCGQICPLSRGSGACRPGRGW